MRYIILGDHDEDNLSKEVTEHMSSGWIPQGGVCVTVSAYQDEDLGGTVNYYCYYQAMTKGY